MHSSFISMIRDRLAATPTSKRHKMMADVVEEHPQDLTLVIGMYRDPSTSEKDRWWLVTESDDIVDVDAHRDGAYEAVVRVSAPCTDGLYPCCLNCGQYGIERLFCSVYCQACFVSDLLIEA